MPSSFWLGILLFGSITLAAAIWRAILLHRLKPPTPPLLKWRHPTQYDEASLVAVETIFGAPLPPALRSLYLQDAAALADEDQHRRIYMRKDIPLAGSEVQYPPYFRVVVPMTTHNATASCRKFGNGTLILAASDEWADLCVVILRQDGSLWWSDTGSSLQQLPATATLDAIIDFIKTNARRRSDPIKSFDDLFKPANRPLQFSWAHPRGYRMTDIEAVEDIFGAALPPSLKAFYLNLAPTALRDRLIFRNLILRQLVELPRDGAAPICFNWIAPLTVANALATRANYGPGLLHLASSKGDGFFDIFLRNDGTLWFSEWFDQLEPLPPQYDLEALFELIKAHAHPV